MDTRASCEANAAGAGAWGRLSAGRVAPGRGLPRQTEFYFPAEHPRPHDAACSVVGGGRVRDRRPLNPLIRVDHVRFPEVVGVGAVVMPKRHRPTLIVVSAFARLAARPFARLRFREPFRVSAPHASQIACGAITCPVSRFPIFFGRRPSELITGFSR